MAQSTILVTDSTATLVSTLVFPSLIVMSLKTVWWSLLLLSSIEGRCHSSDASPWRFCNHRVRRRWTYTSRHCTCSWFLIITTLFQLHYVADWCWILDEEAIASATEMAIAYQHKLLCELLYYPSVHLNLEGRRHEGSFHMAEYFRM